MNVWVTPLCSAPVNATLHSVVAVLGWPGACLLLKHGISATFLVFGLVVVVSLVSLLQFMLSVVCLVLETCELPTA